MADRGDGRFLLLSPFGHGDLARPIADLAGQDGIGPEHVAEAIQHRSLDSAPRRYCGSARTAASREAGRDISRPDPHMRRRPGGGGPPAKGREEGRHG